MSSGDELNINGMQNLVCTVYNNNTVLVNIIIIYIFHENTQMRRLSLPLFY